MPDEGGLLHWRSVGTANGSASVVEVSDEETVAIPSETVAESLANIRENRQIAVRKRLHGLPDNSAPQHYTYESLEGVDELQTIREGGDQRLGSSH